jgi:hypothetical protein
MVFRVDMPHLLLRLRTLVWSILWITVDQSTYPHDP